MSIGWGNSIEVERHNRIRVLLWAYAYEIENDPLATDAQFDETCRAINTLTKTGKHDRWFKKHFDPSTGMWIHRFTDLQGIQNIYKRITNKATIVLSGPSIKTQSIAPSRNAPFRTHFENMCYTHYLGFDVVPGFFIGKEMTFQYRFEGGCLYAKSIPPAESVEKCVVLKEIFEHES